MEYLLVWLAVLMAVLSGCGSDATEENNVVEQDQAATEIMLLPDELPRDFTFCSGAGAWSTELTLNRDGTFSGMHHDSDMGSTGEGYPNGTVYTCRFEGRFKVEGQIDEYTYSLRLVELATDEIPDTEQVKDGVRYIAAEPYGLESETDFLLYLPGTPYELLTEDFLFWRLWMGDLDGEKDCLSGYAIRNVATEYGFFSGD